MANIIKISIKNFKRAEAVEIDANGAPVVEIVGENSAGKTSVIEALVSALRGARYDPTVPTTTGQEKTEVVIALDNGVTIDVMWRDGMARRLKCRDVNGKAITQTTLTKMLSTLSHPLAFSDGDKPADQRRRAEMLRNLVGLDLTGIDKAIDDAEDARLLAGRAKDAAIGHHSEMVHYTDGLDPVDVPAMLASLAAANERNREIDQLTDQYDELSHTVLSTGAEISELNEHLAMLDRQNKRSRDGRQAREDVMNNTITDADEAGQADVRRIRDRVDAACRELKERADLDCATANNRCDNEMSRITAEHKREEAEISKNIRQNNARIVVIRANIDDQNKRKAAAESEIETVKTNPAYCAEPVDTAEINTAIETASAHNAAVGVRIAANRSKSEALSKSQSLAKDWQISQNHVVGLRIDRRKMIASIKMPLDGIGFDDSGNVTMNGAPWEQAGRSEKIRMGVRLSLLENPELPILFVDNGESLDRKSLAEMHALMVEFGAQLIIATVGDRDSASDDAFVIESGVIGGK